MVNRLHNSTSPYLLQHATNPVDWQPWDDAALAQARAQNKPIFLSIGYSACHWCHVMERESFEDERIASLMNAHFVNIKVDREERPDLDTIYMGAVSAMTGHGGWPMSVFLTPDGRPFYGGTYFPPYDRGGMPGFYRVLESIALSWEQETDQIITRAGALTEHLHRQLDETREKSALSATLITDAVHALGATFDAQWGGWTDAPKFPSPPSISLLLRHHRNTGNAWSLTMATSTLDAMARGGIYDHIGGGFHRYSVDAEWRVPHFEKMLYDNAQLALAYTEAWQVTRNPAYRRVAEETLNYVIRDMGDIHGGYSSSEDADSEGGEGMFYLWGHEEIVERLGQHDGTLFCDWYSVVPEGNFPSHEPCHHQMNVLHINPSSAETPEPKNLDAMNAALMRIRERRPRPGRDDKVLSAWNALLISALTKASSAWNRDDYRDAAQSAGAFLRDTMLQKDTLARIWRKGVRGGAGYLDDYAYTANAFIDLYECTFDSAWIEAAQQITSHMIEHFHDPTAGAFHYADTGHRALLVPIISFHDNAEPSANAMAALALLRLSHLLDREQWRDMALNTLELAATHAKNAPQGFLSTLCVADFLLESPVECVFVGDKNAPNLRALLQEAYTRYLPNRILAVADTSKSDTKIPLAHSKSMIDNQPTAYLCHNNTCLPPTAGIRAFAHQLDATSKGGTPNAPEKFIM